MTTVTPVHTTECSSEDTQTKGRRSWARISRKDFTEHNLMALRTAALLVYSFSAFPVLWAISNVFPVCVYRYHAQNTTTATASRALSGNHLAAAGCKSLAKYDFLILTGQCAFRFGAGSAQSPWRSLRVAGCSATITIKDDTVLWIENKKGLIRERERRIIEGQANWIDCDLISDVLDGE